MKMMDHNHFICSFYCIFFYVFSPELIRQDMMLRKKSDDLF